MALFHQQFLDECLQLAAASREQGESGVGSLVVKEGKILGKGTEQSKSLNDVTRHAEVMAILDATRQHGTEACRGATLYSNVEPCVLCSYVIRHHQFDTVVYMKDAGDVGGTNPQFPILTTTKVKAWPKPPRVIKTG